MAKEIEAVAIGIGPQSDQATVNTDVSGATDLISGPASASGATGILMRSPEDLSKAFERIESDGGTVSGSLSRVSGVLSRVEPTVSFIIDAMGSRFDPLTPASGEYDLQEYMKQILSGARFDTATPSGSNTVYTLIGTPKFKTLKIWRGTEEWSLVGCTFNLTLNLSAGVKATWTVDVVADSVLYNSGVTFPPATPSVAYGNSIGAAPILESALSTIDGVARAFQTGTIGITYEVIETQDANIPTGLSKSQGTRSIDVSLGYFMDSTQDDFPELPVEANATTGFKDIALTVGILAGAGGTANALKFEIPNLRITSTDKIDGANVLRTIEGYAAIAGTNTPGGATDEEMRILAV